MSGFSNTSPNLVNQQSSIYQVLKYIDSNIQNKLDLNQLASLVSYSPFHFHRLFKSVMGVNLNDYITNYRLQRVSRYLKYYPHLTLTEIAERCGFSSLNDFSRKFKAYHGQTATQVRDGHHHNRKICIMDRNISERYFNVNYYNEIQGDGRSIIKEERKLKVILKMLPQYRVTFLPLLGTGTASSFQNDVKQALLNLAASANSSSHLGFQNLIVGKVHYESPQREHLMSWRFDACITIPTDLTDDSMSVGLIAGGLYAVLRILNSHIHKEIVLDSFYHEWLPNSGYRLSDEPCLEVYGSRNAYVIGFPAYVDYCIPLLD